MFMTIFGQNYFLESFKSDSPNINFLEYYDVQNIKDYFTERFYQVERLEKQWGFEFSSPAEKVYGRHGNIHAHVREG